jgi:stage II sporulation protein D
VESLPLDEYLAGVVAAEMPALFDEEALKAQAVAARTYTMKKIAAEPVAEHNGAAVCANPSHCKAYAPLSETAAGWNSEAEKYTEKILRAVAQTDGEILLYDGEPILAVYHASSYLQTRPSSEVFGGDRAYLVSVSVPFEDDESTKLQEKRVPRSLLYSTLEAVGEVDAVWDGSRCVGLRVGDKTFASSDIRSLFGLASASFEVSEDGEDYVFKTYGHGHGVGLSQSGADILAQRGWSYFEILFHYYKNTSLAILKNNE